MESFLDPIVMASREVYWRIGSIRFVHDPAFWGYLFLILWYDPHPQHLLIFHRVPDVFVSGSIDILVSWSIA
jgi:hypothetical protein